MSKYKVGDTRNIVICKHKITGKFSGRFNNGSDELWWTGRGWSEDEKEALDVRDEKVILKMFEKPKPKVSRKAVREIICNYVCKGLTKENICSPNTSCLFIRPTVNKIMKLFKGGTK